MSHHRARHQGRETLLKKPQTNKLKKPDATLHRWTSSREGWSRWIVQQWQRATSSEWRWAACLWNSNTSQEVKGVQSRVTKRTWGLRSLYSRERPWALKVKYFLTYHAKKVKGVLTAVRKNWQRYKVLPFFKVSHLVELLIGANS